MSNSTHAARSMLDRRKRFAGVAAIATCLTAAALIATARLGDAAAPERKSEATSLQKDLDALVGAGVPGAILLARDGDHSVRLTAGLAMSRTRRRCDPTTTSRSPA